MRPPQAVASPAHLITESTLRTATGRRTYYAPETSSASDGTKKRRACLVCGKVRIGRSPTCRECYMQARASTYLAVTCAQCGTKFTKMRAEVEKARRAGRKNQFCSHACHAQQMRERPTARCAHCGTPFPARGRKYCSTECVKAARPRKTKKCPRCGTEFLYSSERRVYCGKRCADAAHSDRMVGTGNSRYRTGKSYAAWFRAMRPLIMERDGHQCRVCSQPDKPTVVTYTRGSAMRSVLRVHHIDENPANNRPENLITLCQTCHLVHHKSAQTPFPWFASFAASATRSMTSRWMATATSLLTKYSSTTA